MFRHHFTRLHGGMLIHRAPSSAHRHQQQQLPPLNVRLLYKLLESSSNSNSSSSTTTTTTNVRNLRNQNIKNVSSSAVAATTHSKQLRFVEIANRPANDVLRAVAQDLKDRSYNNSNFHNNSNNNRSPASSSSSTMTTAGIVGGGAADSSLSPILVCQLITKICEECNLEYNAVELMSQQEQEQEQNTAESESNSATTTTTAPSNPNAAKYGIQKHTVLTLILSLSRLSNLSSNDNHSNNNHHHQHNNSRVALANEAERAMAALCELALPHVASISPPEWFGIVNSFSKLNILQMTSSSFKNSTTNNNANESQRVCAFFLHLALEKLFCSTDAGEAAFLLRVRDSLQFSLRLSKMLPQAIAALPEFLDASSSAAAASTTDDVSSSSSPPPHLLHPTWQHCVGQLLKRQIMLLEICTAEQATHVVQNACLLIGAFSSSTKSSSSPSPSSLKITMSSSLIESFSELLEAAKNRIQATLAVMYEETGGAGSAEEEDNTAASSSSASNVGYDFYSLKFNTATAIEFSATEAAKTSPHALAGSINNLFAVLMAVLPIVKTIMTNANTPTTTTTTSSLSVLESTFGEFFKLCLFVAEAGPLLLDSALHRVQFQQQQQNQQDQEEEEEDQQANRQQEQIRLTVVSNLTCDMMQILNNHVLLNNALANNNNNNNNKNVFVNEGGRFDLLREKLANSKILYEKSAAAAFSVFCFQPKLVSSTQSLLQVLQCLSNQLREVEVVQKKTARDIAASSKNKNNIFNNNDDVEVEEEDDGAHATSAAADADDDHHHENNSIELAKKIENQKNQELLQEKEEAVQQELQQRKNHLFSIALRLLFELEQRTISDPRARSVIFQNSRTAFGTARRLIPLFSVSSLLEQQQTSEDAEKFQPLVSASFKALLRIVKAGLNQRPRPQLGAIVAVARFLADDVLTVATSTSVTASGGGGGGDDAVVESDINNNRVSSTSSSSSIFAFTKLPLGIRDAMFLDIVVVLHSACQSSNLFSSSSSNSPINQLLQLVSILHRLHRATSVILEENEFLEERQTEKQTDDQKRSTEQLQLVQKKIFDAAQALCRSNRGGALSSCLHRLHHNQQQQQQQNQSQTGAEEELTPPTRVLLSLVQRLSPLSSILSSSSSSSSSSSQQETDQQHQQQQQQTQNNINEPIHETISYILLTMLPARIDKLSALEATLALNAMHSAKLWRQSLVANMMAIVRDKHARHVVVATTTTGAGAGAVASFEDNSENNNANNENNENATKEQVAETAAKEISLALISLCQLSSSSSSSSSSAAAAASSLTFSSSPSSEENIVDSLVSKLTEELPFESVSLQRFLSVWRKLAQSSAAAISASNMSRSAAAAAASSAAAPPFAALEKLMKSCARKISEMKNADSSNGNSSSSHLDQNDLISIFVASTQTLRIALNPTTASRRRRREISQLVVDLVTLVLPRIFLSSSSSSSSERVLIDVVNASLARHTFHCIKLVLDNELMEISPTILLRIATVIWEEQICVLINNNINNNVNNEFTLGSGDKVRIFVSCLQFLNRREESADNQFPSQKIVDFLTARMNSAGGGGGCTDDDDQIALLRLFSSLPSSVKNQNEELRSKIIESALNQFTSPQQQRRNRKNNNNNNNNQTKNLLALYIFENQILSSSSSSFSFSSLGEIISSATLAVPAADDVYSRSAQGGAVAESIVRAARILHQIDAHCGAIGADADAYEMFHVALIRRLSLENQNNNSNNNDLFSRSKVDAFVRRSVLAVRRAMVVRPGERATVGQQQLVELVVKTANADGVLKKLLSM